MKEYKDMDVQELARYVTALTAASKYVKANLDEARDVLESRMAQDKTIKLGATVTLPDGSDLDIGTITRLKTKAVTIENKPAFLQSAIGIGTHLAHHEAKESKGWQDYIIYEDGQFIDKLTGCPVEGLMLAPEPYDGLRVVADTDKLILAANALGTTPLALAEGRD